MKIQNMTVKGLEEKEKMLKHILHVTLKSYGDIIASNLIRRLDDLILIEKELAKREKDDNSSGHRNRRVKCTEVPARLCDKRNR